MPNDKLIIFGSANQAEMMNFYFEKDTKYKIAAFVVDDECLKEDIFCDKPVIPFSQMQILYPKEEYDCFVAIGYTNQNRNRERVYSKVKKMGYYLPTYISKKATIFETLVIGDNCLVLENVTIQPFAQIGNNVCLWSGSYILHHGIVGDHCFIGSNVVAAGAVVIGRNSFVGVNSTIRDGVKIAEYSLIGAHSWINKSTIPYGVYSNKGTDMIRQEKI